MDETTYIMLLADGETFTTLSGCEIYRVPAGFSDEVPVLPEEDLVATFAITETGPAMVLNS